jgi:hypothetical protein
MTCTSHISIGVAALLLSASVLATKPIIYPAKGQSAAQQQTDDGECYTWAKGNTGVDPAVLAQAPPPPPPAAPPPPQGGGRVAGAAKGAVVGGLVSGGDTSGANAGAVVGAMAGGAKSRQKQHAQAAQQQAQPAAAAASQQQAAMDTFFRAYGACMEGRGYTIK